MIWSIFPIEARAYKRRKFLNICSVIIVNFEMSFLLKLTYQKMDVRDEYSSRRILEPLLR
jgi:hypothetical protein